MKKTGAFLLGFVTVNLLWLAAAALLDTRALPGPAEVYAHFGDVLAAGVFRHIGASLWRVFAGLFLALGARGRAALTAVAAALTVRLARCAFRCRLGALDGQGDLAVRCDGKHLDGNRLPVAQHSRKILHKLVRNLGDVDKTGLALRQRNERAERLDTSDLALDNIPNL